MTDDRALSPVLQRVGAAATAMRSGDPKPYIDCWANLARRDAVRCVGTDGARRGRCDGVAPPSSRWHAERHTRWPMTRG
jgi:hypothetical protein